MIKLYDNEIEAINNFIQKFATSTVKTLSQAVDNEVLKKFEFVVNKSLIIENLEPFKEHNILYKLDYAKGLHHSDLAVLVPEELAAILADVMMGGQGDKPYAGDLAELEINSTSTLIKKVFKDIENLFKKVYTDDFAFGIEDKLILQGMPEYDEEFVNNPFDLLVNQTFRINEEKEFTINLLLKAEDIKKALISLNLLRVDKFEKVQDDGDSINLDHIQNVKIDITAELGSSRVPIKYALELVKGSIIELDTLNNSDIKVFANNVEVAMAQIVVIEDNFGLRITRIISPEERLKTI